LRRSPNAVYAYIIHTTCHIIALVSREDCISIASNYESSLATICLSDCAVSSRHVLAIIDCLPQPVDSRHKGGKLDSGDLIWVFTFASVAKMDMKGRR
jgi:hypothetical protein